MKESERCEKTPGEYMANVAYLILTSKRKLPIVLDTGVGEPEITMPYLSEARTVKVDVSGVENSRGRMER